MNTATETPAQATAPKAEPETLARHVLRYDWSTSRGRDTYGYNLLTLREGGYKVASTCGGGYDMMGTVLADFLVSTYPIRLAALAKVRAMETWDKIQGKTTKHSVILSTFTKARIPKRVDRPNPDAKRDILYGLTYYSATDEAVLDGECGLSSVHEVYKALGLELTPDSGNWNRNTRRSLNSGIYFVSPL